MASSASAAGAGSRVDRDLLQEPALVVHTNHVELPHGRSTAAITVEMPKRNSSRATSSSS